MAELKRNELNRQNFLRFRGLVNATKSDFPVTEMEALALYLAMPLNFKAYDVSDTAVNLSWTTGDSNYQNEIELSTNGGNSWTALVTKAAGATTHSHTGLNSGTIYKYRIRSKLDNKLSGFHTVITALTFSNLTWTDSSTLTWIDSSNLIFPQ
jgi:hypothetical protein